MKDFNQQFQFQYLWISATRPLRKNAQYESCRVWNLHIMNITDCEADTEGAMGKWILLHFIIYKFIPHKSLDEKLLERKYIKWFKNDLNKILPVAASITDWLKNACAQSNYKRKLQRLSWSHIESKIMIIKKEVYFLYVEMLSNNCFF